MSITADEPAVLDAQLERSLRREQTLQACKDAIVIRLRYWQVLGNLTAQADCVDCAAKLADL